MDGRGWSDIAYSFLVDDDGTVYEGRGYGIAGGHTQGDNSTSHAICLLGNFDNRPPTRAALEAAGALAGAGALRGAWTTITGGHRDAPGAQTACPGRYLYAQLGALRAIATDTTPGDDHVPLTDDDAYLIGITIKRSLADLGITDDLAKKVDAIDKRTSRTRRVLRAVAVKIGLTPAQIAAAADGTD